MFIIDIPHPVSNRRFPTHAHAAEVAYAFGIDPTRVRPLTAEEVSDVVTPAR